MFPLDDRLLKSTELLERDYGQIDQLEVRLANTEFNDTDRAELKSIVDELRSTLAAQADPSLVDGSVAGKIDGIAERIDALADDLKSEDYPGPADPAAMAKALAQPKWGETSVEIPPLAMAGRQGYCGGLKKPPMNYRLKMIS